MDDDAIHDIINRLVAEEHELRDGGGPVDTERLARLEAQLDQCWDLLRQRAAKREFNQDPASASPRDVETVENYEQ